LQVTLPIGTRTVVAPEQSAAPDALPVEGAKVAVIAGCCDAILPFPAIDKVTGAAQVCPSKRSEVLVDLGTSSTAQDDAAWAVTVFRLFAGVERMSVQSDFATPEDIQRGWPETQISSCPSATTFCLRIRKVFAYMLGNAERGKKNS
jgi:hypothetical protein